MEFKFRAKDGQPSAPPPQYSSFTYFTEQAIRAGYANSNNYGPPRPNDCFRNNPNDMREAIQRELEKERIREEIIASEISRKRVLEAEVRRELMMEREMALRRADVGGFAFLSHRFEPLPHRLPILPNGSGRVGSFEEQIVSSLQHRIGLGTGPHSHRETGGLEMVPFQRHREPQIAEIKAVPEVNKEKVILLGKPNSNITGVKRKAPTPPAAGTSDLPLNGSKKQPKVEWSCAVCQVSATSERGLNEHLGGKKHKSKEAAMRAQKTGKNFGIGLFPKKTITPIKLAETTANPSSVEGIMIDKKSRMLKKKKPVLRMKQGRDDPKTGDEDMGESKKKKFRFWCEMCQAGAFSEKVMNHHRRGKKHVGRLLVLQQNNGAASRTPSANHSVEDAEEESKKMEPDLVAIEETTDAKVKLETASGTPSAKHSEEAAEEESKKMESDVVPIEETTDTKVKVETVSGTPSAQHMEEAAGEESKKMESDVVALEETTNTKIKVEIPLKVRDVATEKINGVMEPHQGSKEVADIGGMD